MSENYNPPSHSDFVQVGIVFGVDPRTGWVSISPQTDNHLRFQEGSKLFIKGEYYVIHQSKAVKSRFLLDLNDLSAEQSASLKGEEIYVEQSQVPLNKEGTYYHFQLIGLKVFDIGKKPLGSITEIIVTGANDVYVVRDEESELLIPAISSVIQTVNLATHEMVVEIPNGLEPRLL